MKKAKITSIIAALALAFVGLAGLGAKNSNAAGETIVLEPGSKIPIRQEIRSNGSEELSATFTYKIEEMDGLNAVSNLPTTTIPLSGVPFINNLIQRTIDADMTRVRVIAQPGEYKMKLTCTSDAEYFSCGSDYYTFIIAVENVLDNNRIPTGEYTARIYSLRKVVNGREIATKLEEANFYSEEELPPEPVYSHISLETRVEGDLAKETDVFKYVITVDGAEDQEYTIIAPSGEYVFGDKPVESDTTIRGGGTATIYLRHGETATIGLSEDGENQILVGMAYSYTEYPDIKDYKTWVDSKDDGERTTVTKMVAVDPKNNHTVFINSNKKPTIPEIIDDIVNTGLKYKNGAFVVLATGAAIAIVAIVTQRKKKKIK